MTIDAEPEDWGLALVDNRHVVAWWGGPVPGHEVDTATFVEAVKAALYAFMYGSGWSYDLVNESILRPTGSKRLRMTEVEAIRCSLLCDERLVPRRLR